MRKFRNSGNNNGTLRNNQPHNFAMQHALMLYRKNALYTFIPKNACSTFRYSIAVENGCIENESQINWIHANNQTFNPTLSEAIKVDYSFVVLRCPYARLASVFLDKIVSKENDAWQLRELQNRNFDLNSYTFYDFVKSLSKPHILNANIHWKPQSRFLLYKEYDDYFCFEKLNDAIISLKKKIGFEIIDTRKFIKHGTDRFEKVSDKNYSRASTFEIQEMMQNGLCPAHSALYNDAIKDIVGDLYKEDISLYIEKFGEEGLLF